MNINELYEQYAANPIKWMEQNSCITTKDITILLMKEAIKQAIPIILKEVSEKACLHTIGRGLGAYEEVDKDSILSLEQELIQKLLKNE